MNNIIDLHSHNASIHETVDFDKLSPDSSGAQPTNHAGEYVAFNEQMTGPDGSRYEVIYGFSRAEEDAADGEASNLCFDVAHVVQITRAD